MVLALIGTALVAIAGGAAFYHPDDVAARSKAFAASAEQSGPAFESAQDRLNELGAALQDLDLAAGLLGERAPAELGAWYEESRKTITGQFLRMQKHVDLVQEDYQRVFGAALDRALPAVAKGKDARKCRARGLPGLRMPASTCEGEDLNAALAAALDKDAALARELADMRTVPWPEVGIPPREIPLVRLSGEARTVQAGALARALVGPATDEARARYEEDAADGEDVERATRAQRVYVAELGRIGSTLWPEVEDALKRAGSAGAGVASCPNPAVLGGCPGKDDTRRIISLLIEDKKLAKRLGKK